MHTQKTEKKTQRSDLEVIPQKVFMLNDIYQIV